MFPFGVSLLRSSASGRWLRVLRASHALGNRSIIIVEKKGPTVAQRCPVIRTIATENEKGRFEKV